MRLETLKHPCPFCGREVMSWRNGASLHAAPSCSRFAALEARPDDLANMVRATWELLDGKGPEGMFQALHKAARRN